LRFLVNKTGMGDVSGVEKGNLLILS
jgi:hypothetical protein